MIDDRTWECPECGMITRWSYDDLAERGRPVCMNDDVDMDLVPEE